MPPRPGCRRGVGGGRELLEHGSEVSSSTINPTLDLGGRNGQRLDVAERHRKSTNAGNRDRVIDAQASVTVTVETSCSLVTRRVRR